MPDAWCASRCGEMMRGHYLDLFLGIVEETLRSAGVYAPENCLRGLEEALLRSTHVARARSVAYLVGFCRYFGRLVESYGVSPYYTGVTPGKGTLVHKILALASLNLFERVDPAKASYSDVEAAVDEAISEIAGADIYTWLTALKRYRESEEAGAYTEAQRAALTGRVEAWERRVEAARRDAVRMLDNLRSLLSRLSALGHVKTSSLTPLPEMQMVDYDLKVIGTPDLILEGEDGEPSVVVEWKTMGDPERSGMDYVSHAQSWIYALMEARRLGYGSGDSSDPLGELREALDPERPAVLPAVVTPKKFYVRHPLGARLGQQLQRYADPCCITLLLVVGAYHLSALHLIGSFDDGACRVPGSRLGVPSDRLVRVYSYTPPVVRDPAAREAAWLPKRYAGDPDRIEEVRYPCGVCKAITGGLVPLACKLNFSGNRETGLIDEIYYITRRSILARHLKDLEALKAAYHARPHDLLACRGGFRVHHSSWSRMHGVSRCEIAVEGGGIYRYLAPEEAVFRLDPTDSDLVELKAPLERRVLDAQDDVAGLGGIRRPATLRRGKPVSVYLYRNVSRVRGEATRLTHSPAAWLRVNSVDVSSGLITITLGIPSSSLRLGYLAFLRHLRRAGCAEEAGGLRCTREALARRGYGVVAIESQVDLTQFDLRIVGQLRLLLTTMREDLLEEEGDDVDDDEAELARIALRTHSAEGEGGRLLARIIESLLSESLREPGAGEG